MNQHLDRLHRALDELEAQIPALERFGDDIADHLLDGGRVLAVGNGGSAAHAQHLCAELVGRYRRERQPLSAICLHGDASALTAIANDYGVEEMFARQVRAHGRAGDILIALSTSGTSPNVLRAVDAGHTLGLRTWALTGRAPSPLASACDAALAVDAATPTVQEVHQVAIHLLCDAVERRVVARSTTAVEHA